MTFDTRKGAMAKFGNMLLQMTQKIGGNLWVLERKDNT